MPIMTRELAEAEAPFAVSAEGITVAQREAAQATPPALEGEDDSQSGEQWLSESSGPEDELPRAMAAGDHTVIRRPPGVATHDSNYGSEESTGGRCSRAFARRVWSNGADEPMLEMRVPVDPNAPLSSHPVYRGGRKIAAMLKKSSVANGRAVTAEPKPPATAQGSVSLWLRHRRRASAASAPPAFDVPAAPQTESRGL